jgi:hypothetical protein
MTLVFDTQRDGWAQMQPVTQSGASTGNWEAQNYGLQGVLASPQGTLDLRLQTTAMGSAVTSGKIKSTFVLQDLAPTHGALEVTFQIPLCEFWDSRPLGPFAYGLWPAIWLLPDSGAVGGWPCGGELDLFESMHHTSNDALRGFTTAHFGARTNQDYVYDGHWGAFLGQYPLTPEGTHVIRFEWQRLENGLWKFTQSVDGQEVWTRTSWDTWHLGADPCRYSRATQSDCRLGAAGDPAQIFQRAFEDPVRGLHLICNLALGGTPFGQNYDHALKTATLTLQRIQVWRL